MSKTTKQDIKNRLRDEELGIGGGAVAFGVDPSKKEFEETPATDIVDLGLPKKIRDKIEALSKNHAELGAIISDAEAQRKPVAEELKAMIAEHIPEDVPVFATRYTRVARYTQNRTNFSKDAARDALLDLGVSPKVVMEAWSRATTPAPVVSIRSKVL